MAALKIMGATLAACSLLLAPAATAARILSFSPAHQPAPQIAPGVPVRLTNGTTRIQLDNGAIAAFVGAADFTLHGAGQMDLRSGTVTITSAGRALVELGMPGGIRGVISGPGSAARFTAKANGGRGAVLAGVVIIISRNGERPFTAGQFWTADASRVMQHRDEAG